MYDEVILKYEYIQFPSVQRNQFPSGIKCDNATRIGCLCRLALRRSAHLPLLVKRLPVRLRRNHRTSRTSIVITIAVEIEMDSECPLSVSTPRDHLYLAPFGRIRRCDIARIEDVVGLRHLFRG